MIWHFTAPASLVNDLAYKTMLLSGIQGALLNLNPLIKADGYYALSQFLDVDNMREDSFAYLRAWARKHFLRHDIDLPVASRRLRRVYLTFGISAVVYSTTLLFLVLSFLKNICVSKFGDWGYVITLGVIYFFARKSLRKNLPLFRAWLRKKREDYMAWKMTRAQWAGAMGIALLLADSAGPFESLHQPGTGAGEERAHSRAKFRAQIHQVFVHQGDAVQAGQVLATLENPEIEAEARAVTDELALASSNLRSAQGRSDLDQAAPGNRERRASVRRSKR